MTAIEGRKGAKLKVQVMMKLVITERTGKDMEVC